MKLLALEKEKAGAAPDDFLPYLEAEAERAWDLHQAGLIRELYFRADSTEAVLVLECLNLEQAKEVLSSLPLVQAGLITFDLIPLRAYPGFARLFEKRRPAVRERLKEPGT